MTPERSQAYGRVMKTLDDLGPAKLHGGEETRLREAADALLFAAAADTAALEAITDVEQLARQLAETGRWAPETAGKLADDVAACGPGFVADMPLDAEPAAA
jgi:hypothetical protein